MNWLFPLAKGGGSGSPAAPLPARTSLQQQKQRQIESLRGAHASITEIQKDVEYRLPFTVNNLTININILLPPQFPQEKPVISVFPPVRHHLVDKQGVYVTSPLISNFTMHSDLGKIIQSLLDEFWKNPPVLAPSSTSFPYLFNKPAGMPPYAPQGFPFLPPYPPQEANRTMAAMPVAEAVPSSYTADKPAAPSYGLIADLPLPVPTAEAVLQVGQNGCTYKMPDVPDTFPELSELRSKTVIFVFQYEQLTQMKAAFEKKMQRQHELSESCSPSALQARLKVAAHEAEEESDTIAEDFLEGKTEIDDFLSSFMEKRTLCHCRRAKEEKLQQAIAMHSQFHAPL
ncbi:vacuolar protein sorting-associated protein 37A isoform X2 [Patagioenas fasciata]|uniref:vacuolar protein sorting-associated protein 37A isoform X2 n=1 Tax=Patagioenas fasciata TaxID=372321 RepID=UPI003A994CD3